MKLSALLFSLFVLAGCQINNSYAQERDNEPLRIGIVGLVHGHVHGFVQNAMSREDIEVVGLSEADTSLLRMYGDRYSVPEALRYVSVVKLLDEAKPEAITVFSNTFDHKEIVALAAERGIHVMMEKPLAVNMDHALAMRDAAREGNIHVLVNYETTWYGSTQAAYRFANEEDRFGTLRKIVVHDGHPGPKEVDVEPEFLSWLTDPVLNGGGALTDFGCYGANFMTWMMQGEKPLSVTAITQQLKEDPVYARVDDEATILVEYAGAQGIIQASWNWPYDRKDMEVYGDSGYVFAYRRRTVRYAWSGQDEVEELAAIPDRPVDDPFTFLRAVVRGEINPPPHDLSALENNIMVTRILDAARESAMTGKKVKLE